MEKARVQGMLFRLSVHTLLKRLRIWTKHHLWGVMVWTSYELWGLIVLVSAV